MGYPNNLPKYPLYDVAIILLGLRPDDFTCQGKSVATHCVDQCCFKVCIHSQRIEPVVPRITFHGFFYLGPLKI